MLKRSELTHEERITYMPLWEKVVILAGTVVFFTFVGMVETFI